MSFYNPTLTTQVARQWRRLSPYETYDSYGSRGSIALSCRVPRELEWAINNAKAFVFPPRRPITYFPPLETTLGVTNEMVMHVLSPMEFADGYQSISWTLGHKIAIIGNREGGEAVTWRLYCSWSLYRGPDIFDAAYLSPWYGSDSIASTLVPSTHDYDTADNLQVTKDAANLVWLVLTAQSNSTITQGVCTGLSIVGRCA